nr:DNA replication/repair protein RecF [Clostridia bacterium]
MKIKRFRAENFRNIVSCDIRFGDRVNLLYGKNAQGKTNAVEGIYLFSRGRSHRTQDDKEMIRFGSEGFRISIEYESLGSEGVLEYACFGRERLRKRNGYKISKVSDMVGDFKSVLFYPDNLDLVKGGPEERRAFLNVAISQCYPAYITEYSRFKSALENRNSILKAASKGQYFDNGELIAWSETMAEYAAYIHKKRRDYIDLLRPYVRDIGLELSSGEEDIHIALKSDIASQDSELPSLKAEYRDIFTGNLDKERLVGTSLYGPQRDDIQIDISGQPARSFASQGQQRSIVLALKLAEGEVIRRLFGEYPVFLFDDVLSELDRTRRRFVIEGMRDRQVIITSCEGEDIIDGADTVIEVSGGEYVSSHR